MTGSTERPAHIGQDDWNAVDVPEPTDDELAEMKPFKEVFPEQYAAWKRGAGRPRAATPKVHTGFRLAADVMDGIRATGKGYNARVERVLRDALVAGKLDRPNDSLETAKQRAKR